VPAPSRLIRALAVVLGISLGAFAPVSSASAGPAADQAETQKQSKKKGKKKKKKKKSKKKKKGVGNIQKTGLKSLDDFFGDANTIDRRLDRAQKARRTGRASIATAVGLEKTASLEAALKELRKKGKDNLRLSVTGGTPQLTPKGMLPTDVAQGLDAVNLAVESYVTALKDLKDVPAAAASLAKKSQQMPDKLKEEFSTFDPTKIPAQIKAVKTLKSNIKVTTSLPKRSKNVVKGLNSDLKMVVETFGGTWPPKPGADAGGTGGGPKGGKRPGKRGGGRR
jgi:hypothetical protein